MKKLITIGIIMLAIGIIFTACGTLKVNKEEIINNEKNKNIVQIKWEFKNYIKKDESGVEIPYTDLLILLSGAQHEEIRVGTYAGTAFEIDDMVERDFPLNTIMACECWYAGAGVDLCVVRIEKGLAIKERRVEEFIEDAINIRSEEFKEVTKIELIDNYILEPINSDN